MLGTSQSFAFTPAIPADPMAKKPRQEEKQTVLPVSIRLLETAAARAAASESGSISIHGSEPGMLLLVAVVEAWMQQSMSVEFRINDGTGRLKARYYITDRQLKDVEGLGAGQYVSLFGNVRTAPEFHFAVAGIRPVRTADEVSYHMIEVVHTAMKLQRCTSTAQPKSPKTPEPKQLESLSNGAIPASSTLELQTPVKTVLEGAALRTAVLDYLKTEGDGKPEGLEFDAVCTRFQPAASASVREALDHLVDAGDVFTTIDDMHYSCV